MTNPKSKSRTTSPKGKQGEDEAERYLRSHGYSILERNWSTRWAELDIIALDGNTLVFVEVKTRFDESHGSPQDAMTPWKIRSLIRSSELYKSRHPELPDALRIDFVGVSYTGNNRATINLIKNITG